MQWAGWQNRNFFRYRRHFCLHRRVLTFFEESRVKPDLSLVLETLHELYQGALPTLGQGLFLDRLTVFFEQLHIRTLASFECKNVERILLRVKLVGNRFMFG